VITGETTPAKILDLQGEDIRSRFAEIEQGIVGALDFLKREAAVKALQDGPVSWTARPSRLFLRHRKI